MQTMLLHGSPTDDEAAAIAAAVASVLQHKVAPVLRERVLRPAWRSAAILEAQGLGATRDAGAATWGNTGRATRARRWSKGIVGL